MPMLNINEARVDRSEFLKTVVLLWYIKGADGVPWPNLEVASIAAMRLFPTAWSEQGQKLLYSVPFKPAEFAEPPKECHAYDHSRKP